MAKRERERVQIGTDAAGKPVYTWVEGKNRQDFLIKAAQTLLGMGVKNVFISLGGEGVYYANAQAHGLQPALTLPAAPKRPAKPQAQPRAPQQPQQSRPARQQPPKAQNAKRKSEAGLIRALAIVAGILAVILLVSLVVLFTKNKKQTDSLSVPASASCVLLRQGNAPTGLWETQL